MTLIYILLFVAFMAGVMSFFFTRPKSKEDDHEQKTKAEQVEEEVKFAEDTQYP